MHLSNLSIPPLSSVTLLVKCHVKEKPCFLYQFQGLKETRLAEVDLSWGNVVIQPFNIYIFLCKLNLCVHVKVVRPDRFLLRKCKGIAKHAAL